MKVLIATDGSKFSQAAVEMTCDLIKRPDETDIELVSVWSGPTIAAEPFVSTAGFYQEVCEALEAAAEISVKEAHKEIVDRFPNVNVIEKVVMGVPGQTVVELAKDFQPDILVVGSHGRGFWSRMLLGSVSETVVHHAPCSVLVVRGDPDAI